MQGLCIMIRCWLTLLMHTSCVGLAWQVLASGFKSVECMFLPGLLHWT